MRQFLSHQYAQCMDQFNVWAGVEYNQTLLINSIPYGLCDWARSPQPPRLGCGGGGHRQHGTAVLEPRPGQWKSHYWICHPGQDSFYCRLASCRHRYIITHHRHMPLCVSVWEANRWEKIYTYWQYHFSVQFFFLSLFFYTILTPIFNFIVCLIYL